MATAYLFAVPLQFGLLGMVMGPALCGILMAFLFAVPYGCHLAGFSAMEYWTKAYLWLSLAGLSALAGFTLFYAVGVYFLVLNMKDKNYVKDSARLMALKMGLAGG